MFSFLPLRLLRGLLTGVLVPTRVRLPCDDLLLCRLLVVLPSADDTDLDELVGFFFGREGGGAGATAPISKKLAYEGA